MCLHRGLCESARVSNSINFFSYRYTLRNDKNLRCKIYVNSVSLIVSPSMERCEFGNARLYVCVSRPRNECRRTRYKLPGPGGPELRPGSDYIAYVYVFLGSIIICRLRKLTL